MRDARGSAVAEVVMVSALLAALVLAVLQLALALHVRNTLQDAASEGARVGAVADGSLTEGVSRTQDLIRVAVGDAYAADVSATQIRATGRPVLLVTVRAPFPMLGLIGVDGLLEVHGRAPLESVG